MVYLRGPVFMEGNSYFKFLSLLHTYFQVKKTYIKMSEEHFLERNDRHHCYFTKHILFPTYVIAHHEQGLLP